MQFPRARLWVTLCGWDWTVGAPSARHHPSHTEGSSSSKDSPRWWVGHAWRVKIFPRMLWSSPSSDSGQCCLQSSRSAAMGNGALQHPLPWLGYTHALVWPFGFLPFAFIRLSHQSLQNWSWPKKKKKGVRENMFWDRPFSKGLY